MVSYVACVQTGNLVYNSGQGCKKDGVIAYQKILKKDLKIEEWYIAAEIVIMDVEVILKNHLRSLDRVKRVVKLLGLVASAQEFDQQLKVMNGTPDLLLEIFGDKGQHAFSAIGMNAFPSNMTVETE